MSGHYGNAEIVEAAGYVRIKPAEISLAGAHNLVEAVVKRVVEDWEMAVEAQKKSRQGWPSERRLECEKFFCSDYFFDLTGLDGRAVLERLKKLHDLV